ncbi:conserved protein, unknown function [Hepatocystis sp. ex Piliocolobus tephrosceles]|nr:conserved protein, unknown function [Hepatocystis sp. ex Piliocolobus tephrosceles]VWU51824.1 conserved protein, unknown function [Hepatocystis sp. ex Piliocolobus tephrosceles]
MDLVKLVTITKQNNKRLLNTSTYFNDLFEFLSRLTTVPVFRTYYLPKVETNYEILKKHINNILINRVSDNFKKFFESISVVFWKGRKWKGTYWPSKWKWYHRHGYWATRKKLISFDKYRPYRYHEVKGYGKPKLKDWQDYSYYRPLKQTTKFW